MKQAPGESFLICRISDDDGMGGRPLKSDLDSRSRQLSSPSFAARARVWAAKIGMGAAALAAFEKQMTESSWIDIIPGGRVLRLLKDLAEAGMIEGAVLAEITAADLADFPNVDVSHKLSARSVKVNEALLKNEMTVGGTTAIGMFNFWTTYSGPVAPVNFPPLDAATSTTGGFKTAAEAFEAQILKNLRAQQALGNVDYHDLVTGPGPERPSGTSVKATEPGKATGRMLPSVSPVMPSLSLASDTTVKICIGSFQGIRVHLTDFNSDKANYAFTLNYELRDHFGVDDEDCEVRIKGFHGTPGQVAMWVLQHFATSGHKPFLDQVLVARSFKGTF